MAATPFYRVQREPVPEAKDGRTISVSIDPERDTPAFLMKATTRMTELLTEFT
jgi:cytochrome oxidase Cu insertion factor (SCO1/SenC/PrrC family)